MIKSTIPLSLVFRDRFIAFVIHSERLLPMHFLHCEKFFLSFYRNGDFHAIPIGCFIAKSFYSSELHAGLVFSSFARYVSDYVDFGKYFWKETGKFFIFYVAFSYFYVMIIMCALIRTDSFLRLSFQTVECEQKQFMGMPVPFRDIFSYSNLIF